MEKCLAGIYFLRDDYIKMHSGEDGITRHIMTLIGACLFLIGATIALPAFFGYQI